MRSLEKIISRETITYLICGGLTTVVGFGSYVMLVHLGLSTAVANTLSTVLAVLFAYVVNKVFVFKAQNWDFTVVAHEFAKFVLGRLAVFFLETLTLVFLVDFVGFNSFAMKACTMVLVVVGNYCFSKWVVFRS